MRLREAAEVPGVHYQTAYLWVRRESLALRRIGDNWAAGLVSIAQEHRASSICERLIALSAGARCRRAAADEITAANPRPIVLAGRPGDSLRDLIRLARARHG